MLHNFLILIKPDMLKRLFDTIVSFFVLIIVSPILSIFMFLIWKQDKHNPFYLGERVGKNEQLFTMVKLRSMIIGADRNQVDSTSAEDNQITQVGHLIRKYKLLVYTSINLYF